MTGPLAMVEENEIRSNLSFYERGRLASEAARLGIFDSAAAEVRALFVHAPAPKRSKILCFVTLHDALGSALNFPEAIPEKLGSALVKALQQDPELASHIKAHLRSAAPDSAVDERALLDNVAPAPKAAANSSVQIDEQFISQVRLKGRPGRISLSGRGVTEDLVRDLAAWLASRD